MASKETLPGDAVALVARALRSLDVAAVILPGAARRAPKRSKPLAPRSLKSALRSLLGDGASDRKLRLVLGRLSEAMLEGIVLFGGRGEITYANDNLCRMLGRTRGELVGQAGADFFQGIHWPSHGARPGERYETELRTKAGRAIVVEVCNERIEAGDGTLAGSLAVMIDITARANALRQSESEVRLLSAQFVAAQELERQRIARELHDGIGQALGGVKFALEGCEAQIAGGCGEAAKQTLRVLSSRMQEVIDEVRRVSMNLRPSTLDDLGILPTLGWFTREFRAIYTPQVKLDTIVEVGEEEIAVPVKTAIYRIVQEAFNNVVTHSGARRVALALRRRGGQIELQVQDDGAGFDAAARAEERSGLGLATMRERAEVTGGRFALRSEKGRGTTVSVIWPTYQPRRKSARREICEEQ
jgi:PAS domain S-box-containing protein